MSPLIIKSIIVKGVTPVLIATSMFVSGITNIENTIEQYKQDYVNVVINHKEKVQEEIQKEIDGLIDFYTTYERQFVNHKFKENVETYGEEVSVEVINEIREEALYNYMYREYVDISDKTVEKMKEELTERNYDAMLRRGLLTKNDYKKDITKDYLRKIFKIN